VVFGGFAPNDHDGDELMAAASPQPCVPVDAWDPLYVLYTSGTTGMPKGVVRDQGGHAVALRWSLPNVYDTHPGQVFWAASDVGWVVGRSYIVWRSGPSRRATGRRRPSGPVDHRRPGDPGRDRRCAAGLVT
jgi:acyl-coenzyme A synthetase/AMP-(fatty) acid ligase